MAEKVEDAAGVLSTSEGVSESVNVGVRLRHARLVKGYLLRDVAERVGCSVSLVSKFENDKATPSLSMLHRLVSVLDINVSALFEKPDDSASIVARQGSRPVITVEDGSGTEGGIKLERIIPYGKGHLLQASIHIIAAGADSHGAIRHEGEEVGYVLEGEVQLVVDGQSYRLQQGDAFVFDSNREHSYANAGTATARILWVNTPPTF